MSRTLILISVLSIVGCGGKKDEPAKQAPSEPAPSTPKTTEAPKTTEPPKPSGEYASHIAAGEKLETQLKWSEALVEYEAALTAKPNDATALGEVGYAAFHVGNLGRAKEASLLAVEAAGKDDKLRGAALYNLGRAIEKAEPNAAAAMYATSNSIRPRAIVKARLATIVAREPTRVRKTTPDGDALLAKLHVDPISLPPARAAAKPLDRKLFDALDDAGVEFQGAAGKAVAMLDSLSCTQDSSKKPPNYACTNPAVTGDKAKALVENLIARKIAGTKQGDTTTFAVSSVRCTSHDVEVGIGKEAQIPADECEVTK